jgi:hypothetical protein
MADWKVSAVSSGTGDGSSWANNAGLANLQTILSGMADGDSMTFEADVLYDYAAFSPFNVQHRGTYRHQSRLGVTGRAIWRGVRTDPWPQNGLWTDPFTNTGCTLTTSIASSGVATITITGNLDSTALPWPTASSFYLDLDNETILITSRTGQVLTVGQRGVGGTTAVAHTAGVAAAAHRYLPAVEGVDIFHYKDAAAAGGGSSFDGFKARNCGIMFRPNFSRQAVQGDITVSNCSVTNGDGIVYPQSNNDGQCNVHVAGPIRGYGFSLGLVRAFGDIVFAGGDGYADAKNEFHTPATNLFGMHCQDAIVNGGAPIAITFTAATSQVNFGTPQTGNQALAVNDPISFLGSASTPEITDGTVYFVKTVVSPSIVTLSATLGGATLTFSVDGTAIAYSVTPRKWNLDVTYYGCTGTAAAPPAGSSKDPNGPNPSYPQGDNLVCEENTNIVQVKHTYFTNAADRGFDSKAASNRGDVADGYYNGNGFDIAMHDDTVIMHIVDSWFGTPNRPFGQDKCSNIQASGNLDLYNCQMDLRPTGSTSIYFVAYGSVQPSHVNGGLTVPQRCGHFTVDHCIINLKAGYTKTLLSPGGVGPVTPTYTETNTVTNTV